MAIRTTCYLIFLLHTVSFIHASALKSIEQVSRSSDTTRQVQENLREIGWPLTVDGLNGPATTSAVRNFQEGWTFKSLSVDGIAGPLTRAEIAKCVSNGGRASDNFKFAEFKSKGNGDIKVVRKLLFGLERLRAAKGGKSLRIVSGYRDPAHNRKVGGASNSQHLYGTAADIPREYGASPSFVIGLGYFTGIGIKCRTSVTHVDVRSGDPRSPTTWPYSC